MDHFLRKRQKAEAQRRDGSRRLHQSQQLTESILWANPLWACILTALDCARIALNIIVAPDMPRPLLMEDLIDGIVSVIRCQLEGVVCKPSSERFCSADSLVCDVIGHSVHVDCFIISLI